MYKVVIVDDEPLIRTGLISLIDWEALSCTVVKEAEDGEEAFSYLQENEVDLVVCDIRMPGMDGLQFAKAVYETNADVKIIFLTAFSEFSYVQEAIHYGVVDYVVKSNYIEKIPGVVQKATALIDKVKQENELLLKMKNVVDDNMQELREKLVLDILLGLISDKNSIREKMLRCQMPLSRYYLIVFEISGGVSFDQGGSGYEKFLTSLKNFISRSFSQYEAATVAVEKARLASVISLPCSLDKNPLRLFIELSDEIVQAVKGGMDIMLNVGISGEHTDDSKLTTAYEEACAAMQWASFFEKDMVTFYEKNRKPEEVRPQQLQIQLEEILEKIEHFSKKELKTLIEQMLLLCEEQKVPVNLVRSYGVHICSACYRKVCNQREKDTVRLVDGLPNYKSLHECKTLTAMRQILLELVEKTEQALFSQNNKYGFIVKETLLYIENHFMDDINLSTIAEQLHVNKSYLGNLYKKETGESIVETINRCRIEKAIELLRDPGNRIFDISGRVGFTDPAYFTNVFTRYMGVSPKAYRNTL